MEDKKEKLETPSIVRPSEEEKEANDEAKKEHIHKGPSSYFIKESKHYFSFVVGRMPRKMHVKDKRNRLKFVKAYHSYLMPKGEDNEIYDAILRAAKKNANIYILDDDIFNPVNYDKSKLDKRLEEIDPKRKSSKIKRIVKCSSEQAKYPTKLKDITPKKKKIKKSKKED